MNKKFLLVVLTGVIILTSCSRTKPLLRQERYSAVRHELNYLGKKKEGSIKFKSGKVLRAAMISVSGDSLYYQPVHSTAVKKVSLREIESIYFKDRYVGTFDGALLGFLGGLLGGCLYVDTDSDMAGFAIAGISAGGLAAGAVIGALIGSKIEYKVSSEKRTVHAQPAF